MRVLIVHQNFPGQFRRMAPVWAKRPGWDVLGIGRDTAPGLPDVRMIRYRPHRDVGAAQHHYLRRMEDAVLHGQAVARVLMKLRAKAWRPDVILAHPGWGETLYAKDVFPDARLIHFCEWFYNAKGADIGFDPEFPSTFDQQVRVRTWNALHLLNLENADALISPTEWQSRQHPEAYRGRIHVIHEGIDVQGLGPDSSARFTTPSGVTLRAGDPVVTYVARNLEPYRGFHTLMRSLPQVLRENKHAQVLVVGGDDVSYGSPASNASNWREQMLKEVGDRLDLSRVHFLGKLAYSDYLRVLQVSAVHLYLGYPFVLSWSMLEAMASGCQLVAGDTAPVREVATERSAILVKPLDPTATAEGVLCALEERYETSRRIEARAAVSRFDAVDGLRRFTELIEMSGRRTNLSFQHAASVD